MVKDRDCLIDDLYDNVKRIIINQHRASSEHSKDKTENSDKKLQKGDKVPKNKTQAVHSRIIHHFLDFRFNQLRQKIRFLQGR